MLDGAAEQWRLENGLATNAIPTFAQVNAYIKSPPTCPSGGGYRYDTNSGIPSCSVPGHMLSKPPPGAWPGLDKY